MVQAKIDYPEIDTFTDVNEMLAKSKLDLVVIITPHNTHAALAVKCLGAAKHVVCEKPLAITTEECDEMIAAARSNDVVLSTFHNRHWDGCILEAVRQVKQDNAIGDVFRIEAHMQSYGKPGDWWRSSKSISGGILYDWGVHLLEYSLQIMDGSLTEVSGYAKKGFWGPQTVWKDDTNEDEGFLVARFDNSKWITLSMSSIDSKPKENWLEITGTKGAFTFDFEKWTCIRQVGDSADITSGKNPDGQNEKYYQNIADHLVNGDDLVITPEWSRRPIHILDLACRSATEGQALRAIYA